MKNTIKHLICAICVQSLIAVTSIAQAEHYAIVIGNGQFNSGQLENLRGAVNDAKEYESILEKNGFIVKLILDESLAKTQMTIMEFTKTLKKGDTLTFIYCGHGRNENNRPYLCLKDSTFDVNGRLITSTAISVEVLLNLFESIDMATLTLVLDACRNSSQFNQIQPPERFNMTGSIVRRKNTTIIYATLPGQISIERDGRGVFSMYFIKGLTGYGDILYGNMDDKVTFEEAFKYAVAEISKLNIGQMPFAEGVWSDAKNAPFTKFALDASVKKRLLAERELVDKQEYDGIREEIDRIALENREKQKLLAEQKQVNERLAEQQREAQRERERLDREYREQQRENERLAKLASEETKRQNERAYQLQMQQQQARQEMARRGASIGLAIARKYAKF